MSDHEHDPLPVDPSSDEPPVGPAPELEQDEDSYAAECAAAAEAERLAYEQEQAAKAAKENTPTGLDITADEIAAALTRNQLGDAELFIRLYAGKLCKDNTTGEFFHWNCSHWVRDKNFNHLAAMDAVAALYARRADFYKGEMARFDPDQQKEEWKMQKEIHESYRKRASQVRSIGRASGILDWATAGSKSIGISGDEWNANPTLFVCKNGVLDLATGKIRNGEPGDWMNMSSSVEWRDLFYVPTSFIAANGMTLWEKFLWDIFEGNEELIAYVQRLAGYWFTGLITHQEFVTLWGEGRNGKGIFCRVLRAAMGDYYCAIPSALLMDSKLQNATGPNQTMVALRSRRLAVASESKKGLKFDEAAIKNLTGGDPIAARGLYSSTIITYVPECKLLFATNDIPRVHGNDQAFKARLRIVRFNSSFTADDPSKVDPENHIYLRDPLLEDRLKRPDQLSYVLSWAVRGAMDYIRTMRLDPPACVMEQVEDYMNSQDPIGEFLKTCLIITDGKGESNKTAVGKLHKAYVTWCKTEMNVTNEKFIHSLPVFTSELERRKGIVRVPPKNYKKFNLVIADQWMKLIQTYDD